MSANDGSDRLAAAWHEPDLAREADDLRLEHQILHEGLGGAMPDRVMGQVGRIDRFDYP